jgi:lipopolysaccharide biosynthesis glycosyltransferase
MAEINKIDMGFSLIAGVKDIINLDFLWPQQDQNKHFFDKLTHGEYLNSGFLLMNLKKIRSENLYAEWVKMSRRSYLKYPDQDILNYTCEGKKFFLPQKYNFIPLKYSKILRTDLYSSEEHMDAILHPVMIHYAGMTKKLLKEKFFHQYARMAAESITPNNSANKSSSITKF